ncbi:methyl-accepting chemotaxis protein [Anaerocolumna cellulosilytica]|uniref:Methyl-accepting chemotaxis protein n=1 Tax=Anaerocolumna cellulosilytica TaxID=433286 RepID=A0A6S6R0J8_9FIRM|nr:methyl-accepting chemotaxis protein [Anaerocolumna cellulosilytica]MBB5198081.1 methyl-accepting chemotaxis protein [Anaerocolumna cellulosilytica]BCJ95576.1 methyl-accepting chemotaxis protein [Anaerocolumna cellulosilytica]
MKKNKQPLNRKKRITEGLRYYKEKFMNLSIKKRLNLTFLYIGAIAFLVLIIGVFNIVTIDSMLKGFYTGPFLITENVKQAQSAMKTIENNIYRAYITNKESLCYEYIQASEEEYDKVENCIQELATIPILKKGKNQEYINSLNIEIEKGNRYRNQILESAKSFDQKKIYSIYKNDYVPIWSHMLTEFEEIETFSEEYRESFMESANQKVLFSIIGFLGMFLAGTGSCIYILIGTERSITKPIDEIKEAMVEISRGQLQVEISYHSKDEMGILCEAVRKTLQRLNDYISNITYVIKQLEDKNMTIRVGIDYEGGFAPIKISLDNTASTLQEVIRLLFQSAKEMTLGADQIAQAAKVVADGSEEQSQAINRLSGQLNEIALMVNKNAKEAADVYTISIDTVEAAKLGDGQIKILVNAMTAISAHAGKISQVIAVVEEIADQTNFLSLNASIEAARAGSAGRGFAIVASEIGKLATESREAVKSTTNLIESTVQAIQEGVALANETSENFKNIVQASLKTNQVMDKIADNAKEEAGQLNTSMEYLQQIAAIIETNSDAARESSAMSEEFISQAEILEQLLGQYTIL